MPKFQKSLLIHSRFPIIKELKMRTSVHWRVCKDPLYNLANSLREESCQYHICQKATISTKFLFS